MQECLSDDAEHIGVIFAHDESEVAGVSTVACSVPVVHRDEDVSGSGIRTDQCGDIALNKARRVIVSVCFVPDVVEVWPTFVLEHRSMEVGFLKMECVHRGWLCQGRSILCPRILLVR
jgi:hypothetical protein